MAAIDVSRRYELEHLVGELRLAARTIRASTVETGFPLEPPEPRGRADV
ncbi:MAG TPA: hypothetical protein VFU30_12020 [Gaiellaceae bacterium]|nr:hypothetical protein [Gaiellaceae bacterium]